MELRVTERHCIMPIANLPSALAHRVLSCECAARFRHMSVATQPEQAEPGGAPSPERPAFHLT